MVSDAKSVCEIDFIPLVVFHTFHFVCSHSASYVQVHAEVRCKLEVDEQT